MTRNTSTVLIVDDQPAITSALRQCLEKEPDLEVTDVVASSSALMRALSEQKPDVVVGDLFLEDTFGLDLLRTVRTSYDDLEIVVYSLYDEEVYAERTLRAGARAYLNKREPTEEVVKAVHAAAEGRVYLARESRKHLLAKMAGNTTGSSPERSNAWIDALTDRELAVFQMLGEGFNKNDIASRLNLSPRTVETYRRQAREKLSASSSVEFLRRAVKCTFEQLVA